MAALSSLAMSTTRYSVCLFHIHPSRSDILNENGFAVQVQWERGMTRFSGNSDSPTSSSTTASSSQARQPTDFSSLAATLGSTSATDKNVSDPLNHPGNAENSAATWSPTTSWRNPTDQSNACVIELTDYESFWRGRLTREDWESQRDPAFEASVYEKWTRAAFSGDKQVDGYKVALTARKTVRGMVVTWTVSKQEGTGEKRNLLGSITLTPCDGDRRQQWADWTLNSISERDRFQLQLASLQKRADNMEQLAMTSQAMLVSMRQEKTDDKSDFLEKVRALINSKKAKIRSLVNRNKHLESELETLRQQMAQQIKPDIELEVKPDKGKRRARTPAPKGVADKTPATSQESVAASDLGFTSTIPRTQRLTTGKRGRRLNTPVMPSPESDPMYSDPVVPDTMFDASQDPPSDLAAPSYHSGSDPLSVASVSSHLTSSSHLSLMERVSQAVSQPRNKPRTQHTAEISKDMALYTDDDEDYSAIGSEMFDQGLKKEYDVPQMAKARGTLGGESSASVQVVDPASHSVEKYKRGPAKPQPLGPIKVKQEEPAFPTSPAHFYASNETDSPPGGHSDDLLPKKKVSTTKFGDTSRSAIPKPTTPTSILSSNRRLPAIGKKMLTTGANTSTRMRALEKHKISQQQAQGGNGNSEQRREGDTTSSTFSVSSASLANQSGAYSPDHSMDQSRIHVLSAASSPSAAGVSGSDNNRGSILTATGTKRGSGARSPRSTADVKRARHPNAVLPDSLLLPDTDELFKRLQ